MVFFYRGDHGDLGVIARDIVQNVRPGHRHGNAADRADVDGREHGAQGFSDGAAVKLIKGRGDGAAVIDDDNRQRNRTDIYSQDGKHMSCYKDSCSCLFCAPGAARRKIILPKVIIRIVRKMTWVTTPTFMKGNSIADGMLRKSKMVMRPRGAK